MQLQTSWVLSWLRGSTDGRYRCALGAASSAGSAVGVELFRKVLDEAVAGDDVLYKSLAGGPDGALGLLTVGNLHSGCTAFAWAEPMNLYNLFPLLVGPVTSWKPHLERAAGMAFDWVFVNPIHQSGKSNSLYSIRDYFRIDERFVDAATEASSEAQVRQMCAEARDLGLRMMADLVINHCAADSPLLEEHPEWFAWESDGEVSHPFADQDGERVVWRDLARFDFETRGAREGLVRLACDVVDYLVGLGFSGFRCDAAYQVPPEVWRRVLEHTRGAHPDVVFAAETLGCTTTETEQTAKSGFDYLFNSVKWWDYESEWLFEQQALTRQLAPSIGFAESHDTPRLFAESRGSTAAMRRQYLLAAFFSEGILMPVGYEFGFEKALHVSRTLPKDWEEPHIDLQRFVRRVNEMRCSHDLFRKPAVVRLADESGHPPHSPLLLLHRHSLDEDASALLVLNRDLHGEHVFVAGPQNPWLNTSAPVTLLGAGLDDDTPERPLGNEEVAYRLKPGQALIFVAKGSRRSY